MQRVGSHVSRDDGSVSSYNSSDKGTVRSKGQAFDFEAADGPSKGKGLETAIFGILFTLAREKVGDNNLIAAIKLALDAIQQMLLLIKPSYGWYDYVSDLSANVGWLWGGLEFMELSSKLQTVSAAASATYAVGALLLLSLCLCAYVGWCFQRQKFPYVWPVWVLRFGVSLVFQPLYVTASGILLSNVDCHFFSSDPDAKYYLEKFPESSCLQMPHLLTMCLAIFFFILYTLLNMVTVAADFELNPLAEGLLAACHSRTEVFNLLAKLVLLLADTAVLSDVPRVQALVIALAMLSQLIVSLRWMPALEEWGNHARASAAAALTLVSIMLVINKFADLTGTYGQSSDLVRWYTYGTLLAIMPAMALGALASWARMRSIRLRSQWAFRSVQPGQNLKHVYRFGDVYLIEVAARVCRKYCADDPDVVDPAASALANLMYKAGISRFPKSAWAFILYSNFMIEVQGLHRQGAGLLMTAAKLPTGPIERFALFVREQENLQKSGNQSSGESAADLVSYIEFQKSQRLLLRAHQQALSASTAFWRLLLHNSVRFPEASAALLRIHKTKSKAQAAYRTVLERYPQSVKLLRSYARFCEEVLVNISKAQKLYLDAERLEEQQLSVDPQMGAMGGGRLNDVKTLLKDQRTVVLVINASGIIQMANSRAQKLFGYKARDLEGRNVSMLMPPPFSTRHNSYLARYLETETSGFVDTGQSRMMVAMDRAGRIFGVDLAVSIVSGSGSDTLFMGILKPAFEDEGVSRVWATLAPGLPLICVDKRFEDWFARNDATCRGVPLRDFIVEQDEFQRLQDLAFSCTELQWEAGAVTLSQVHIPHTYATPVPVTVRIERKGTQSEPILLVNISVSPDMVNRPMVVFNPQGRVVFASHSLAGILGYSSRAMYRLGLPDLLHQPYRQLHCRSIKDLLTARAPSCCRTGLTVGIVASNRNVLPVRLHIVTREQDDDQPLHVVEVAKSSLAEAGQERCIRLLVNSNGVITTVLHSDNTPSSLFGLSPASLVGCSLSDVLHEVSVKLPEKEDLQDWLATVRTSITERGHGLYLRTRVVSLIATRGSVTVPRGAPTFRALNLGSLSAQAEAAPGLASGQGTPGAKGPPVPVMALGAPEAARAPLLRLDSGKSLTRELTGAGTSTMMDRPSWGAARRLLLANRSYLLGGGDTGYRPDPGLAGRPAVVEFNLPSAADRSPAAGPGETTTADAAGLETEEDRDMAHLLGRSEHQHDEPLLVCMYNLDKLVGILEVTADGVILSAGVDDLHRSGILFGQPSQALLQRNLADLLILPSGHTARTFITQQDHRAASPSKAAPAPRQSLAGARRPSMGGGLGGGTRVQEELRGGGGGRGGGVTAFNAAPRLLQGRHSDGQPLWLMCQIFPKEGSWTRHYVRIWTVAAPPGQESSPPENPPRGEREREFIAGNEQGRSGRGVDGAGSAFAQLAAAAFGAARPEAPASVSAAPAAEATAVTSSSGAALAIRRLTSIAEHQLEHQSLQPSEASAGEGAAHYQHGVLALQLGQESARTVSDETEEQGDEFFDALEQGSHASSGDLAALPLQAVPGASHQPVPPTTGPGGIEAYPSQPNLKPRALASGVHRYGPQPPVAGAHPAAFPAVGSLAGSHDNDLVAGAVEGDVVLAHSFFQPRAAPRSHQPHQPTAPPLTPFQQGLAPAPARMPVPTPDLQTRESNSHAQASDSGMVDARPWGGAGATGASEREEASRGMGELGGWMLYNPLASVDGGDEAHAGSGGECAERDGSENSQAYSAERVRGSGFSAAGTGSLHATGAPLHSGRPAALAQNSPAWAHPRPQTTALRGRLSAAAAAGAGYSRLSQDSRSGPLVVGSSPEPAHAPALALGNRRSLEAARGSAAGIATRRSLGNLSGLSGHSSLNAPAGTAGGGSVGGHSVDVAGVTCRSSLDAGTASVALTPHSSLEAGAATIDSTADAPTTAFARRGSTRAPSTHRTSFEAELDSDCGYDASKTLPPQQPQSRRNGSSEGYPVPPASTHTLPQLPGFDQLRRPHGGRGMSEAVSTLGVSSHVAGLVLGETASEFETSGAGAHTTRALGEQPPWVLTLGRGEGAVAAGREKGHHQGAGQQAVEGDGGTERVGAVEPVDVPAPHAALARGVQGELPPGVPDPTATSGRGSEQGASPPTAPAGSTTDAAHGTASSAAPATLSAGECLVAGTTRVAHAATGTTTPISTVPTAATTTAAAGTADSATAGGGAGSTLANRVLEHWQKAASPQQSQARRRAQAAAALRPAQSTAGAATHRGGPPAAGSGPQGGGWYASRHPTGGGSQRLHGGGQDADGVLHGAVHGPGRTSQRGAEGGRRSLEAALLPALVPAEEVGALRTRLWVMQVQSMDPRLWSDHDDPESTDADSPSGIPQAIASGEMVGEGGRRRAHGADAVSNRQSEERDWATPFYKPPRHSGTGSGIEGEGQELGLGPSRVMDARQVRLGRLSRLRLDRKSGGWTQHVALKAEDAAISAAGMLHKGAVAGARLAPAPGAEIEAAGVASGSSISASPPRQQSGSSIPTPNASDGEREPPSAPPLRQPSGLSQINQRGLLGRLSRAPSLAGVGADADASRAPEGGQGGPAGFVHTAGNAADDVGDSLGDDSQRGRRIRKMLKLLGHAGANKVLRSFLVRSTTASITLFLIHTACFTVLVVLLSDLRRSTDQLAMAGVLEDYMHRAALGTRAMEMIAMNRSEPGLYGAQAAGNVSYYATAVMRAGAAFRTVHTRGMTGAAGGQHVSAWRRTITQVLLTDYWPRNASAPVQYVDAMDLADLGTRLGDAFYDLSANSQLYTQANDSINHLGRSKTFVFIHQQVMQVVSAMYDQVLFAASDLCKDKASKLYRLMLGLLIVEACGCGLAACAYLMYLLSRISRFRYALFTVFLLVPLPAIKAVATRKVVEEESDEDDEEQEEWEGQGAVAAGGEGRQARPRVGEGAEDTEEAAGVGARGSSQPLGSEGKGLTGGKQWARQRSEGVAFATEAAPQPQPRMTLKWGKVATGDSLSEPRTDAIGAQEPVLNVGRQSHSTLLTEQGLRSSPERSAPRMPLAAPPMQSASAARRASAGLADTGPPPHGVHAARSPSLARDATLSRQPAQLEAHSDQDESTPTRRPGWRSLATVLGSKSAGRVASGRAWPSVPGEAGDALVAAGAAGRANGGTGQAVDVEAARGGGLQVGPAPASSSRGAVAAAGQAGRVEVAVPATMPLEAAEGAAAAQGSQASLRSATAVALVNLSGRFSGRLSGRLRIPHGWSLLRRTVVPPEGPVDPQGSVSGPLVTLDSGFSPGQLVSRGHGAGMSGFSQAHGRSGHGGPGSRRDAAAGLPGARTERDPRAAAWQQMLQRVRGAAGTAGDAMLRAGSRVGRAASTATLLRSIRSFKLTRAISIEQDAADATRAMSARSPQPPSFRGASAFNDQGSASLGAGKSSSALPSADGSKTKRPKRQLITSLLEGGWMLSPFLVWAVLVISIYAASCVSLATYNSALNPLQVSNYAVWRVARVVYYAQELCARANATQPLEEYRSRLQSSLGLAQDQYYVLMYGSGTPLVPESGFVHHAMTDVAGAVEEGRLHELLFGPYGCMRYGTDGQPPCPAPGSPFYQQTHQGLLAAADAVFQAASMLVVAGEEELELSNPQLALVWQVSLNDLRDGLLRVRAFYIAKADSEYRLLLTLHVVLFIASCLLTVLSVVYMARPYVRGVKQQLRDVAEVLSELPQEIDAERVLGRALASYNPDLSERE